MANILFASNSVSHFPGAEIGTDTRTWDTNRVPYSIETQTALPVSSPLIPETTTDETWYHFRHTASSFYLDERVPIVELVDATGVPILLLRYYRRAQEYELVSTIDNTSFSQVRVIPMQSYQLRTYDLQVLRTNLNTTLRVYMNENLLIEEIRNVNTKDPEPRYMAFGGADYENAVHFYSEIIVADGDTRNSRLDLLRPVAAGAYGQWNGLLSSLADDDPTTGMSTTLDNRKQSTVLTPYTGAENISNVVQVTTALRGVNSPTKLNHFLRLSTVDYPQATDFDVSTSKEFQVTDWRINPATSLPWSSDDLDSIEFGFESKA